jgi:hypothetical protein
MTTNAVRCLLLVICSLVCPALAAQDNLRILGIAGGDEVIVMYDARTADRCADDEFKRSTGGTPMGDLRSQGSCNSELAIFSENHAMVLEQTAWTDGPDTLTISLPPLIDVPVSVWIANGASAQAAKDHMKRTNELYRMNRVGVRFLFNVKNVSDNPAAVSIIMSGIDATTGDPKCTPDIAKIQQSAFYTPKTLNVYYVDLNFRGRNCALLSTPAQSECPEAPNQPKGDGNINFFGTDANRATLAHEFGHALGLRPGPCGGHTDKLADFDSRNIMKGVDGDENRDHFTLGQVFRMNTHADRWGGTMLIENGLRPGPGRHCAPMFASDKCPALKADFPPR